MKSIIEILADVLGCSPGFVQRYVDNNKGTASVRDTLEAMKIAMRQAYEAGKISGVDAEHGYPYLKFDEWFNKLEGGKE